MILLAVYTSNVFFQIGRWSCIGENWKSRCWFKRKNIYTWCDFMDTHKERPTVCRTNTRP